jgi:hypothetical protein
MISGTEQTILLSVAALVALTSLIVVAWQLWRRRGKDDD